MKCDRCKAEVDAVNTFSEREALLRDCWQALGMMGERFPEGSLARIESECLLARIRTALGETAAAEKEPTT